MSMPDQNIVKLLDNMFAESTSIDTQVELLATLSSMPNEQTLPVVVAYLLDRCAIIDCTRNAIDLVGTGGDGVGSFNISTASALLVSSIGHKVVKHGNKSITSKCGSADLITELGINMPNTTEQAQSHIKDQDFTFLYAPYFHPVLAKIQQARKQFAKPTPFNLVGPLVNPAKPAYRLIGVYDRKLIPIFANILANDPSVSAAMVVHSGGMDELTTTHINEIAVIRETNIEYQIINTEEYGFNKCTISDLKGGNTKENAALISNALQSKRSPAQDQIIINAAAALTIIDEEIDLAAAISQVRDTIDSGAPLKHVRNCTQGA